MYAIVFDFDLDILKRVKDVDGYADVFSKVKNILAVQGFTHKTGNMFVSRESISSVDVIVIMQSISKLYPWFAPSLSQLEMYRIEEVNDLLPAMLHL